MTNEIEAAVGVHVVDRARAQLCAASTRAAELSCADATGARRIVRWQPEVVPYTDADRRRLENVLRMNAEKNPSYYGPGDVDKLMAAYRFPTQYNPIRALQIDSDGNIWVLEQSRNARDSLVHRFRVLNPDGEQIAFATGFEVSPYTLNRALFFSNSAILRRITNADGVEQIGFFPIRK
jgi:hypothetical protein